MSSHKSQNRFEWKRLLVITLFAAFAFGGTFSDISCSHGDDNATVNPNDGSGSANVGK